MIAEPCREVYRGSTISLQVLSRSLVSRCAHDEPSVVISITVPGVKHPQLQESPNLKGVLRLHFSDTESPGNYALNTGRVDVLFSDEMARAITKFVQAHLVECTRLFVVNCDAGVSRSAAVAAALSRHYNGEDNFFRKHFAPNKLVQKLMAEAFSL